MSSLLTAPPVVIGWVLLAFTLIPVGDAATVLSAHGKAWAAGGIHGETAAVMLFRRDPVARRIMTVAANWYARQRRFLTRRRTLLDVALRLAEDEGWEAVTTRRLAGAIDFSQPVIYQHFKNRDDLVRALVVEGFVSLTGRIQAVATSASTVPLENLCRTYIDFGTTQPRLYQAMFTRPTTVPFADLHTPSELRGGDALVDVIAREAPGVDVDAAAELYWACCHGLVTLLNAGRIPAERLNHHVRRVAEVVSQDNQD